jgi:hypothetical protein
VSESLDRDVRDILTEVAKQVQELWSFDQASKLFKPVLDAAAAAAEPDKAAGPGFDTRAGAMNRSKRGKKVGVIGIISRSIFSRSTIKANAAADPIKRAEVQTMVAVCRLYTTVLNTLEAEHCTSLLSAIAFSSNLVRCIACWALKLSFSTHIYPRLNMDIFYASCVCW